MNRKMISLAFVLAVVMTSVFFSGCKEEQPAEQPAISWKGDNVVDGVFEAGPQANRYQLEYIIENAVEGGALVAKAEGAEWLTVVLPEDSAAKEEGMLVISMDANEGQQREGRIVLEYLEKEIATLLVRQSGSEAAGPGDDFSITIVGVTLTEVDLKILPKDQASPYLMFFATEAEFRKSGRMEDDAAVVKMDEEFLISDGEAYGETLQQTFDLYAKVGDFVEPMSGLAPGTKYVLYVYGAKVEDDRLVATTEVYRTLFETEDYERQAIDFEFDYTIDGAMVDMNVKPVNYDGYFFFELLEGHQEGEDAEIAGSQLWFQLVDMLVAFGYDNAAVINELCSKGSAEKLFTLQGESPYTIFAIAISDQAIPCSNVDSEMFTTGEIQRSDNQIEIEVTEIYARKANVRITTTNDDPYNAYIYATSLLEGMTDEEIIDVCLEMPMEPFTGSQDFPVDYLSPETEYSVFCFGCVSGTATTDLFRKDFTTIAAVEGTATIKVTWDEYYDIQQVGEIKPGFLDYMVAGDLFIPLTVVTDPADAEVFYYGVFCQETMEQDGTPNTDEYLMDVLLSRGPNEFKKDAFVLSYDLHFFIVALVEDAEGNLSKLWRSEPFVCVPDGVSDPQGFIDEYGHLAVSPAPVMEQNPRRGGLIR